MPVTGRYLFTASMDIPAEQEALFNEVYDKEHVPLLNSVPGVVSVARFKRQELTLAIGGELQTIVVEDEPRYSAIYEVESADVITSDAIIQRGWRHPSRDAGRERFDHTRTTAGIR